MSPYARRAAALACRSTPVAAAAPPAGAGKKAFCGGFSHSAHIVRNGLSGYSTKQRLTLRAPCRQVQRTSQRAARSPSARGRASHCGGAPGGCMQASGTAAPPGACQQKPVARFSTQRRARPSASSCQRVRSAAFCSTASPFPAASRQSRHARRVMPCRLCAASATIPLCRAHRLQALSPTVRCGVRAPGQGARWPKPVPRRV